MQIETSQESDGRKEEKKKKIKNIKQLDPQTIDGLQIRFLLQCLLGVSLAAPLIPHILSSLTVHDNKRVGSENGSDPAV